MCLKNKKVLVTGSGTGIGREVALEFARNGAAVAFHYSSSATGARSGVAEARALGIQSEAFQCDLSDLDALEKFSAQVEFFLGRVDILINNAGITFNRPFLQISREHYQKIYDVNVRAGFFLTQRFLPGMVTAGGGAVCNLTSIHGLQGVAEHSVYAGTKGAIIAYTRALAVEFAHKGVRINAIAPGWISVENHARAAPDLDAETAKKAAYEKIPAGHYGLPADVARLAVFLCSEAAAFIIGQTIVIDGGTSALMSLMPDFRARSSARFGEQYL